MKFKCLLISVLILFFSCKSKERIDPYQLCLDFYELNKSLEFENLFNIHILGIRETIEYVDTLPTRYDRIQPFFIRHDSVTQSAINIPAFRKESDTDVEMFFFSRLLKEAKDYLNTKYNLTCTDDSIHLFEAYRNEVKTIYDNYYKIRVPGELPYNNIEIKSTNHCIQFVLYKNDEKGEMISCYYKRDNVAQDKNLCNHLNTLPCFDKNWYYEIKKKNARVIL